MPERIEDLLRACTVQIGAGSQADGIRLRGTGFFMAPGQIVTAAHVVGEASEISVRWERDGASDLRFSARPKSLVFADADSVTPSTYPDIGILDIDDRIDHPCVGVDLDIPQLDDDFLVFAYSDAVGSSFQLTPVRLTYVGVRGVQPTIFLDLASGMVSPGMGGAALLNRHTGGVCGVLVKTKDSRQPVGGLAVPWSTVRSDLAELLAANRAFNDRDRRWALAAGRQSNVAAASPQEAARSTAEDGNDQPNLLFRVYVPADRLYAAEANKLLSLFRDWLITTNVSGVRQAGYRTASGEMYEFFAESLLTQSDLGERFDDFSNFLVLCASDPSAAAKLLAQRGIGPAQPARAADPGRLDREREAPRRAEPARPHHPLHPGGRDVRGRLFAFYDWCAQNHDIPELVTLARTISRWEDEIVAAVLTGVSNARSEALNRIAKLEARQAYSFRNPANQRRRVRTACTRGCSRAPAQAKSRSPLVTGRLPDPG